MKRRRRFMWRSLTNRRARNLVKLRKLLRQRVFLPSTLVYLAAGLIAYLLEFQWVSMVLLSTAGMAVLAYLQLLSIEHRSKIQLPPGTLLRHLLQVIYPKQVYERIFGQCFSDMEFEYIEALSKKSAFWARWVAIRWYLIIALVAAKHFYESIIGNVFFRITK